MLKIIKENEENKTMADTMLENGFAELGFKKFENIDWDGYAGAERNKDNSEPLIYYGTNGDVIVNETSVAVEITDLESGESSAFILEDPSLYVLMKYARKAVELDKSEESCEEFAKEIDEAGFTKTF